MSVPTGKREEGSLTVLNRMRELAEYTYNILKNEECFPKRDRSLMVQYIMNECAGALACIRHANATFVHTPNDYEYRHEQQVRAHAHLDAMLGFMDLAYSAKRISSARIEYWTGLVVNTDNPLKGWTASDKKRYSQTMA